MEDHGAGVSGQMTQSATYDWEGRGPPLVLVHGWSMDAGFWASIRGDLARTHSVLVPDLAGVGARRGVPASELTVSAQADSLARLIDGAGRGPVTLLGHSMGAMISLALAQRHPALVERLIVVSPPVTGPACVYPDLRFIALPGIREISLRMMKIGLVRRIAATRFSFRVPVPPSLLDVAGSTPSEVIRHTALSLLATDMAPGLPQLRMPVLVLHGEKDAIITPTQPLILMARLPHARLVVFPDVGHCPSIEAPDPFVAAVTSFVGITHRPGSSHSTSTGSSASAGDPSGTRAPPPAPGP